MTYTHPLVIGPLPDAIRLLPANVRAHINALAGGVVSGLLSHRSPETLTAWGFAEYAPPPAPEPEPTPAALTASEQQYVDLCMGLGFPGPVTGDEIMAALGEMGATDDMPFVQGLILQLLGASLGALQDQTGTRIVANIRAKLTAMQE